MNRRRRVYEGKAKILYEGPEPGTLVQYFKDDATAFNNKKHDKIEGKGVLNNRICEYLMTQLGEIGVPTHFIAPAQHARAADPRGRDHPARGGRAQRRRRLASSKRLGIDEGTALPRSIVEFYYKYGQARATPWSPRSTSPPSAGRARRTSTTSCRSTLRINDFLSGLFLGVGIRLVDFKLRVRPALGERRDAHRARRRDQPGLLPAVGRQDQREARQGPLPPRSRRVGGGLSGGGAPARAACRKPMRAKTGPVLVRSK